MIFKSDDLPAPFRPIKHTRSPLDICSFIWSSMGAKPKARVTLSRLIKLLTLYHLLIIGVQPHKRSKNVIGYLTFVYAAPLFHKPINVSVGELLNGMGFSLLIYY